MFFVILFLTLLFAPGAHARSQAPATTIFIHGTLFPLISRFYHGVSAPAGMSLAKDQPASNTLGNLARVLSNVAPAEFPLDTFYLLGWPGTLNAQVRLKIARELYAWIKEHPSQSLTIIGHSHGATIALYLAQLAAEDKSNPVSVDKLILIACPVQKVTSHLAKSAIFKRVYNLYSEADLGQICDPQGYTFCVPILSERFFAPSDNMVQASILLNGQKPGHNDFLLKEQFLKQFSTVLAQLDQASADKKSKNHFVVNIGRARIISIRERTA